MKKLKLFYFIPIILLIIGTVSTIILVVESDKNYILVEKSRFNNVAREYLTLIQDEINDNIYELVKIGQIFILYKNTTRLQFRTYVLDILSNNQGFEAISWNIQINQTERQNLEKETQLYYSNPNITFKEINQNGQLQVSKIKSSYFNVVKYIEPIESYLGALLLVSSSQIDRNITINKAFNTRNPSATEPVKLVTEKTLQPGILIFNPVFNIDFTKFYGYSTGIFRLGSLLLKVLNTINKDIDV